MANRALQFFMTTIGVLGLTLTGVQSAGAQATFSVSSAPTTVTRLGHAELIGQVTLTQTAGVSVAGNIELSIFPVRFTNTSASGITFAATGCPAGTVLGSVVPDSGIAIMAVPAGSAVGCALTLSGIRVSVPESGINGLDARISTSGNSVAAGQNVVRVVDSALDGMFVDSSSDFSFTFANSLLVDGLGTFTIREGHGRGFIGAVGTLGQTAATQVIFQVTGLPDNVSVTFPAAVTSNSGATLTTELGGAQVVTNQAASTRVVYVFGDALPASAVNLDTFNFNPTLNTTGAPGTGTAFIQATLGPIGAATPGGSFPSTAIPRFTEQLLPQLTQTQPSPKRFFFPVSPASTTHRIAVSNSATGGAFLTFRARQDDGTLLSGGNITNGSTLNLLSRQGTVLTLLQMFGSGANTGNVASIEIESQNDRTIATSLGTAPGGTYATHPLDDLGQFFLFFDRRTSAEVPVLSIVNTGTDAGSITFSLRNPLGATVATATRQIASQGSSRETLVTLFGVAAGAIPLSGYVHASTGVRVRASLVNNPSSGSDETPGAQPTGRSRILYPFFAFGGGYSTVVSLINSSAATPARVSITPYQAGGAVLAGTSAVARIIPPQERMDLDIGALFGQGSSVVVGYLVLDIDKAADNPFASVPQLAGMVRFSYRTASAVSPLLTDPRTEFFVTPTVENATDFTGLAIYNEASVSVNVTVEVFAGNGLALGTTTFALPAANTRIQLLRELVPTSLGHDGGFARISSSGGQIQCLGIRGTLTLSQLLFLRGQTAP